MKKSHDYRKSYLNFLEFGLSNISITGHLHVTTNLFSIKVMFATVQRNALR